MSCPCHQPAKWNGMNTVSGPTRSVTCALTLILAPEGVLTHTYSLLRMSRSAAAFGWISTKLPCCSSASHGLERVSSPPPSYSTRRPLVRISGNCLPASLCFCCPLLNSVGSRHNTLTSSCVGHLSTRSGRGENRGSLCRGPPPGTLQPTARASALAHGWQPCIIATPWIAPGRSVFQFFPY